MKYRNFASALFLCMVASFGGCKKQEVETTSTVTTDTVATGTMTADTTTDILTPLEISQKDLDVAVRQAREAVKGIDPDKDPLAYVRTFEANLRPRIAKLAGRDDIEPLPFETKKSARVMYENYAKLIETQSDVDVFVGDRKKGAKRVEAVSLFAGTQQCTAVVIAKNAIATAKHCARDAQNTILVGETSLAGVPVSIDATKFIPVKHLHGIDLDMAILVHSQTIGEVPEDQLPVFASTAMIDAAEHWTLVGYGGQKNDGSDSGVKRLGVVPKLDSDCSGVDVAADYDCTPGFEIVAGARAMYDRTSCPTLPEGATQNGACQGDSGGPVYVEKDGRLFLAGIIRRIEDPLKCGCKQATNVYVRFDKQLPQIRTIAGIEFHDKAFEQVDAN